MAEDSVLNNIASEFKLWGVKFKQEYSNGGHIELTWQVSPDKPVRNTFIPKTGSDWRGWLNQRANVRRLFKQDGLDLKEPPKRESLLHKALSMPKEPPEPQQDQLRAMRAEIGELTEMVLELASIMSGFAGLPKTEAMTAMAQAPQPVEPPPMPMPIPPPPPPLEFELRVAALRQRAPNTRSKQAITYLSNNWNSLDAIARDMGLDKVVVKRKLVYLAGQGKAELSDGRWRKPPQKTEAAKKLAPVGIVGVKRPRGRPRLNGHSLNGHH